MLCAALILWAFWGMGGEIRTLRHEVERLQTTVRNIVASEKETMTTIYQSGGQAKVVTTTRNSGESDADWLQRHCDELAKKIKECPPD